MRRTEHYQQIPQSYYGGGVNNRLKYWLILSLFGVFLSIVPSGPRNGLNEALASSVSQAAGAVSSEAEISGLIEKLRSDDAGTRQSAARALVILGDRARPGILKLVHSPDPGLSQQAAQILLDLPWYTAEDSPAVKQMLIGYGSAEIELRRQVVRRLAMLDRGDGTGALSRLVMEDPSPAVQWTIVECLREDGNLKVFQSATYPADNPCILALRGYALLAVDQPAATEDFRRCAESELADPTDDEGEFDFVIRVLADIACRQKRYDEAADWRRKEMARGSLPDQNGTPTALTELFALQGDYGPIKGLEDDVRAAGDETQKPKLQYAMSRLYQRAGDLPKAEAASKAAFAGSVTRLQRYEIGEFLLNHQWNDFAETELNTYLKMDSPDGGIDSRPMDANVHLGLSGLAVERGDDEVAASEKEQAMLLLDKGVVLTRLDATGRVRTIAPEEIWAEIYWRYLRVAAAQKNESQINRRLEQLLELRPADAEIAIEVVPILRSRGRNTDADLLFKWAFDEAKKNLDENPSGAEALNELAWLCAKCDRNLLDARTWSEKAAGLMPNSAAILDTDAEVNFHLGRTADAVRLETAALKLEPGDAFMKKQLARFMAGSKGK